METEAVNVRMRSVNPATEELLDEFDVLTDPQLEDRLALAAAVFRDFRSTRFSERADALFRAADILDREAAEYGRLMTLEMGKPIRAAEAEARKCAWVCRYYAENAADHLADEQVATDASASWVRYQPLGPVLAIMPWNFPFWQVFRFAAPALMAGNTALLKHASNVPGCAVAIEQVFLEAGLPAGAFQTLLIGSDRVDRVIADTRVAAVTLTGSEPAGMAVASAAGRSLKKSVLELGGSDPFIVMPSADIGNAIQTAVQARTINNGQSCIAAKRFIVHESVYDDFASRFTAAMGDLTVGDPLDPEVDIGPLATSAIREELEDQVERSVGLDARVLTGGSRPDRRGWFYEPTVLADIQPCTPAFSEELFGPVAALFRVGGPDEAIRLANATEFGLGAAAWTGDEREAEAFIDGIDAGAVFVNGMVASDPRLPFGGIKRSGFGRELGRHGIREFVNAKTVWVA